MEDGYPGCLSLVPELPQDIDRESRKPVVQVPEALKQVGPISSALSYLPVAKGS